MLKKDLAGFFAFFLGVFGVHRFYLGQPGRGIAQFLGFFGTIAILAESNGDAMPLPFVLVAFILAPIITGIVFWSTPYERWAAKYDPEALVAQGYAVPQKKREPWIKVGHAATAEAKAKSIQRAKPKTDLRSLKAEGVKYYRSGDYDLAIEAFLEASQAAPTDAVVRFNLACCYALQGQYPDALRQLEHSVTFELPNPERIEQHPALKELRTSEAYRTFRSNNFRRLKLVGLETPENAATQPPPETMNTELLEQLNRLQGLRDSGILTDREFGKQREKLLG